MKIRRAILWFGAVAAVLLVLVVWLAKRPAATPVASPSEPPVETAESKRTVAPARTEVAPATRSSAVSVTAVSNAATTMPVADKAEQAREVLATLNDVPIDFYGKVQDQFGSPVAGASITGSIIYDNGSSNGVREIHTVSDASGLFEFHDGNGESLSVVPRKDGYALVSTNAGFKYSHFYPERRHVPISSQPMVIDMWKLQGAESLVHFEIKTYVPLGNTPTSFDLHRGRRVESGGDIVIQIVSPSTPNAIETYDWSATIKVVNGGLVSCCGVGFEKMLLAPEVGYEPDFVINHLSNIKPWSSRLNGGFYFKCRHDGSYGKLAVAITTDVVRNEAVPVTITGYLNPAGSKNLEVDPALVTEARP